MAKKKKSATELLEEPLITEPTEEEMNAGEPATPFDRAYSVLTATGGERLEMMTRTTKPLAEAINLGYNMIWNFHSAYLRGRIDTLMRVHVSMEGKGRAEMVQALQAGSGVPGEFYDQGNGSLNSFAELDGVDDGSGE